jgi:hypothetical protein
VTNATRPTSGPHRLRRRVAIAGIVVAGITVVAAVAYLSQFGSREPYRDAAGEFAHVTSTSAFAHLVEHPAFAGYGDSMNPFAPGFTATITAPLSMGKISGWMGAWDAETMADGANFVIDQINEGVDVYRPLYSDAELDSDPMKAAAGMFYFSGDPGAPVAFVMAGGGFEALASLQEAFPHARHLHEQGYHVVVLRYRVGAQPGDTPGTTIDRLERANDDLARAVEVVHDNADDWGIDMTGYSVWGSSAGGALASSWGTAGALGAEYHGFERPAAIITAYPSTRLPFDVTDGFPAYFAIVAEDDTTISVARVDLTIDRIRETGAAVQYVKVATGGHGFGLGIGTPAEGWITDAVRFWEDQRS